jgi:hypothetical protein
MRPTLKSAFSVFLLANTIVFIVLVFFAMPQFVPAGLLFVNRLTGGWAQREWLLVFALFPAFVYVLCHILPLADARFVGDETDIDRFHSITGFSASVLLGVSWLFFGSALGFHLNIPRLLFAILGIVAASFGRGVAYAAPDSKLSLVTRRFAVCTAAFETAQSTMGLSLRLSSWLLLYAAVFSGTAFCAVILVAGFAATVFFPFFRGESVLKKQSAKAEPVLTVRNQAKADHKSEQL